MSVEGHLSIVLHAHLPFVRHPEHPDFLEEDWLFEAITECYIPLLRMMERLCRDRVDFRLTMTMTPPLCEMLADPLLQSRYARRLASLRELAHAQLEARAGSPFADVARMYVDELDAAHTLYEDLWSRDLVGAFARFQRRGVLEVITCGATHGFLPLMSSDVARHAQLEVAVHNHTRHFGQAPRGIWLPECAYTPGLERQLAAVGLRYFFLESHGVELATPRPRFGTARPIYTPAGVAAFGRDAMTSHQVWSADEGYPGDGLYREFYRDLGYDLPYDQVRPYLHADGIRRNIGLKFHRITGRVPLHAKQPYVPAWARERAALHAHDFLSRCRAHAREIHATLGVPPHLTAPYDAELFGHWWFEGPEFLEQLLRAAAAQPPDALALITPSEYLGRAPQLQVATPAMSSWGDGGYFKVWLNETNHWIYRHLHRAEEHMVELAERFPDAPSDSTLRRALNQAARELLLAQASDWAFIMTMDTAVPYAEKRTRDHLARFNGLYLQLTEDRLELPWLRELESMDSIFQEIDYMAYHPRRATRAA